MNHIETMKQALDALECAYSDDMPYLEKTLASIEALRAAIAQGDEAAYFRKDGSNFLTPKIAQGESEPVGYFIQGGTQWYQAANEYKDDADVQPLYTALPVADYVPLSDGQIYTAYIEASNQTLRPQDERIAIAFACAIERAVRGAS